MLEQVAVLVQDASKLRLVQRAGESENQNLRSIASLRQRWLSQQHSTLGSSAAVLKSWNMKKRGSRGRRGGARRARASSGKP